MNLIGFKHTLIIIYFFYCKLFMLYDNMIYFACCVAYHGAQYDLFLTKVIGRLLLLFLQGL